jgi:AcrR family transcriptional regulator
VVILLKKNDTSTKDHILHVARSEFAAHGYYATSMDSIVKATGLSKGAIYWHFRSKLDLFHAVLDRQADNVRNIMLPSRTDLKDTTLQMFFLERGERLIDHHLSNRDNLLLWLHISLEAQRGTTEVADIAKEILDRVISELIDTITELEPDIAFQQDIELKELVILFEAIFNGLLLDLQFKRDPELTKKFWRYLVERLLQ